MIEHLVGLYALSSALYLLLGLSSRSSVGIICLAPVLLGQTMPHDSYSWGSLYILSLVANTVFILLFVCVQKLSTWMDPLRRFSTFSFALGVFLLFTIVLFSISLLLSGKQVFEFERLGQILALAMVPTIIFLHLRWNSSSPRKVRDSDNTGCFPWYMLTNFKSPAAHILGLDFGDPPSFLVRTFLRHVDSPNISASY